MANKTVNQLPAANTPLINTDKVLSSRNGIDIEQTSTEELVAQSLVFKNDAAGSVYRSLNSKANDFVNAVDFNKSGGNTIANLVGITPARDGVMYDAVSYYNGFTTPSGGGLFVWSSTTPKSQHNGGTIISPTVPWDGTQATLANFLNGVGETVPGGNGCWCRILFNKIDITEFGGVVNGISDDSDALSKCINLSLKNPALKITVPTGICKVKAGILPLINRPITLEGAGSTKTYFVVDNTTTGDLFRISECWMANNFLAANDTLDLTTAKAGVQFIGFSIVGSRSSPQQNGLMFYDRNDYIYMEDLRVDYLNGTGFSSGRSLNTTQGYIRESNIKDFHIRNCGNATSPAAEFISQGTGDATNEVYLKNFYVVFPRGRGLLFDNQNTSIGIRNVRFDGVMVHGIESPATPVNADLIYFKGGISGVSLEGFSGNGSYIGYYTIVFDQDGFGNFPFGIKIDGYISSGNGGGINVIQGRALRFELDDLFVLETGLRLGPAATEPIEWNIKTRKPTIVYDIDAAAVNVLRTTIEKTGHYYTEGKVTAQVPNNAASAGNTRGSRSVDLQTFRSVATQVASGVGATIAGGQSNTASGVNSTVSGGIGNIASGGTTAIGGGSGNQALGTFSTIPGGQNATTNNIQGQMSYGYNSDTFARYQKATTGLRQATVGTTANRVTTDAAVATTTNQLTLRNNSVFKVKGYVVAFDTVTLDAKEWEITGLIKRGANAAATSFIGSPVISTTFADASASAWNVTTVADTANGSFAVTVQGSGVNQIRWFAELTSWELAA